MVDIAILLEEIKGSNKLKSIDGMGMFLRKSANSNTIKKH